ncbi:MAG TPA: tripartite tricarboxylate transporter TctB family protein [Candidatus Binatia bacterium]
MKVKPQLVLSLILVVFFSIFVYNARGWRMQARLYPWAIGIPMLVLALIQVVLDLKGIGPKKREGDAPVDLQFAARPNPVVARRRAINIFCWIIAYIIAVWLIGFSYSIALIVFLYLKVQSRESWLLSVVLTAAAWLCFWGLFDRLLHLPFPDGALFTWLGLT